MLSLSKRGGGQTAHPSTGSRWRMSVSKSGSHDLADSGQERFGVAIEDLLALEL